MEFDELDDLWRRYKEDGDEWARERLVLTHTPLVKYVAGRMSLAMPAIRAEFGDRLAAHVGEADVISYGLVGLVSAIERCEPERKIRFETFAVTRIKGSIIDELLLTRRAT